MILNNAETRIISSVGWIEKSSLLIIDLPDMKMEKIQIGEADYISLKKISGSLFVAIQHYPGAETNNNYFAFF